MSDTHNTQHSSCCCACEQTTCCCDVRPRRWLQRHKVILTPETASITLNADQCGLDPHDIAPKLFIRRRGTCEYTLAYSRFDSDAVGNHRFILDAHIRRLSSGRYEASVRQGCTTCASFEIVILPSCAAMNSLTPVLNDGFSPVIHAGALDGVSDMFDAVVNFSANICRVLEPGDDVLPLDPADAAALCAAVLCRPVQLVIYDGVKAETVEFSECVGGKPVVVRGAAGSPIGRFPKGASVAFSWTSDNVTAAAQGC